MQLITTHTQKKLPPRRTYPYPGPPATKTVGPVVQTGPRRKHPIHRQGESLPVVPPIEGIPRRMAIFARSMVCSSPNPGDTPLFRQRTHRGVQQFSPNRGDTPRVRSTVHA